MTVMAARTRRWQLCDYDKSAVRKLAHSLGLFETTAALLVRRGISTVSAAEKFLHPKLSDLHPPFLMKDMDIAVARIKSAISGGEMILIYGDYDVDGTTATVILKRALESVGAEVNYYIPERLVNGYGLREDAIEEAVAKGYKLIISVDCGIRANRVVEHARSLGVDFIITDHHPPEGELPPAYAILNPKQAGCNYPEKGLAGCGVAFKLAQAILNEYGRADQVEWLLKIAAIGTIADIVPLTGENRVIAKCGLAGLAHPDNIGLRALLDISGVNVRAVTCYDISYRIAPRINAVGRMGGANAAVELFSAKDLNAAYKLAREMNEQNMARQKTEADIINDIMAQLESDLSLADARVIVLAGERWHRGVIGIAASKVVEKTHRPAVVISIDEGIGYGSGRSIKEFPLLEALNSCQDLFERFGGHSQAAGLTIAADKIGELKARLNAFADRAINDEDLVPALEIDTRLSFTEINTDLMREIARLEPFGAGNAPPVFLAEGVRVVDGPQILRDRHLKYRLSHCGHVLEGFWWRGADCGEAIDYRDAVNVVFTLNEMGYANSSQLQIAVKDISV